MVQVYSSMASATSSIPIEIMASIFQLSLPGLPDRYHEDNSWGFQSSTLSEPLKLGAVCKSWRDIAWSTPFLWSTLAISIDFSNNPERVELIEEWLSRSKALPLRITLILESFAEEEYDDCEPLLAVIAETAYRWHSLDAHMPWEFIINLCNIAEIPIIHTLGLHVTDQRPISAIEHRLLWDEDTSKPAPEKLFVSRLPLKALNINWGSVTEVDADCLLLTDCINILRSSPNLESCQFLNVFENGIDLDSSNPGSGFVHENLRHLIYDNEHVSDANPEFFSVVTLPNLIHFTYQSWATLEDSPLMGFFTRSAFPLLKLEMSFSSFEYEDLRHLFRAAPSITHLRLFPLMDEEELEMESLTTAPLLRELAQASGPDLYDGDATPLLPCLESLEYGLNFGVAFPWSLVPDMFGSPSTFSSPNRRPLKVLKVVNEYGERENDMALKAIPKDVLPKLLELRQAGAEITYTDVKNNMDLFAMSMTFHD